MVNKSGLDAVYYFLFKILYKSTNIGMWWDPQYLILDFLRISYFRNVLIIKVKKGEVCIVSDQFKSVPNKYFHCLWTVIK
jgi:hypothetical protein